uniref:site-specific DNA-methyltransferase n=1 Tax=Prevotella sp. TaxID=59823 RepID=UPI0040261C55
MAVRYIPYFPNTLEGQALLDNFVRTKRVLRYRDNDRIVEHIQRGMPYYEVEPVEQVGDNSLHNMVLRGECLSACAYLKDKGVKVDLVYIDPPFASGADYAKKVYVRNNPKVTATIAQAEKELDIEEMRAFEEKMYGDIWDKERYLNWMYENLMAIKSVMSDNASIYVHLDYHIGHYVKILMDEIFGEDNFVNEIIWQRVYSHNDANRYGQIHDTIFFYCMNNEDYTWHTQYTPYEEKYLKMYSMDDGDGRKYKVENTMGPGGRGSTYEWNGVTRTWRYSKETMEELDRKGLLYHTSSGFPKKKVYLDEMPGKPLQSIWTDINVIAGQAKELVDYATQKPEALLERIIKASSDEGMVVADFFGGSGVTAAVANRLGRRFITSDINLNSIQTIRDRLIGGKAEFEILEVKDGVSLFRNPVQTMDKLKKMIRGLHSDEEGFGKMWAGSIVDTKYGIMPVYLPNLLDSSSRLLDKPMINRIIREALPDLPAHIKRVIVYYIDITDRDDIEQFIKEQNDQTTIEIELRDLKQFLDDIVVEDDAEWTVSETHDALFTGWKVTINSFHSDRVLKKIEEVNLKGQQQVLQQKTKGKEKKFVPITISDEGLETIEWISLDCKNAEKNLPWHSDVEIKRDHLGRVSLNGKKTDDFWDGTIRCDKKPLRMKIRNICGDETVWTL